MSETSEIAIGIFIRLSIAFALIYGLYRLIAYGLSRLPDGIFGKQKERTWEGIQLLYTVPTGIFGFIVSVIFVVIIVSRFALEMTDRWINPPNVAREALSLVSYAGILSSFIFGLYQDYPPTRLKILGVIAVFSAIAGIAFG